MKIMSCRKNEASRLKKVVFLWKEYMKPKGLITIINHNTKIYRRETFRNLNQIAQKES